MSVTDTQHTPPRATALDASAVVAVVGAGAMGAGIAQIAAVAGHAVTLLDSRAGAAAAAIDGIRAQYRKLADKGRMTAEAAEAAGRRLSAAAGLAELAGAALVVEAIVENLEAKQALYRELEGIVSDGCIFGTNTSSISVTAIGAALKRPERLAGLHFFNPAPLMALVEVVSGLATDRTVADTLFATAAAWGKTPVHARSTPGFIVNRVARPYYAEALRVLNEGGADCATLDALMRDCGGFRMGPFELMDMIGHDVNFAVTRSVWNAFYNDPRFTPSLIQQELVDAGFYGRKNGRGFFDYRDGAVRPAPREAVAQATPTDIVLHGQSAAAHALADRLFERGIACTWSDGKDGQGDDGRIAEAGGAVLFVTDGRSATQRAADLGIANVVLIDAALDHASATRIAVGAAINAWAPAIGAAIGLLQAAGFAVSRLNDIPGLMVMRTIAMLANEAADAVNQGVCDARGADAAMRLGVNYPRGPLEWADRIGLPAVRDVLANLARFYGEDRYRVSPLIQQHVFAGKNIHD
ncbi:3-hydroxyacyl-CoA dehydrogenase [Thauera linaloolentis]|uniref:3-hydroxy-acyl-CoA dehydrogenase n=1 Tax=Thauera linaloolentis (strain DSM 12138 / JCM 21573 / CCUG 41526 / CIP 105981 / IAM 15112 / NBRC 102519 / 47Lol) TaxID=1123367 RepID=N6YCV2_THAL4|nr:3-hydroxyacyl-CoA dehydrogenase [Thauera linaloolentis]ENO89335.1 3-hydroxy-acyl-CoA dehydrogenase [Thauera linaloolentis 47Lol = DSM 12138]MCM8565016.1 3-hydroxyacyl-CoA dehydrogenase [Thauera linaloolentis]